jgi:transposase
MSKTYSDSFKQEIVFLRQSGKSTRELSSTYGLGKNTVKQWLVQYETFGNFTDSKDLTKEEREMITLRKELAKQQKQMAEYDNRLLIIQHALSSLLKKKA